MMYHNGTHWVKIEHHHDGEIVEGAVIKWGEHKFVTATIEDRDEDARPPLHDPRWDYTLSQLDDATELALCAEALHHALSALEYMRGRLDRASAFLDEAESAYTMPHWYTKTR